MLLLLHNNLQSSGGTTYSQSVGGSLTVSGSLVIAVILQRTITGSLTLSGAVTRAATYLRSYASSMTLSSSLSTFFIAGGGGGGGSLIRGGIRFMRKFLGRRQKFKPKKKPLKEQPDYSGSSLGAFLFYTPSKIRWIRSLVELFTTVACWLLDN